MGVQNIDDGATPGGLPFWRRYGRGAVVGLLASLLVNLTMCGPFWLLAGLMSGPGTHAEDLLGPIYVVPFFWLALSAGLTFLGAKKGGRAAALAAGALALAGVIASYIIFTRL